MRSAFLLQMYKPLSLNEWVLYNAPKEGARKPT